MSELSKSNTTNNLTRRRLMKFGGSVLAAAPFVLIHRSSALAQTNTPVLPAIEPTRRPFGRALRNNATVRSQPSVKAEVVRSLNWGQVVPTLGEAMGDGPTAYNRIWYQTDGGWIHSSLVQPSENALNQPLPAVDATGIGHPVYAASVSEWEFPLCGDEDVWTTVSCGASEGHGEPVGV